MNWSILFAQWAGMLLYMGIDSAFEDEWVAAAIYFLVHLVLLGLAYRQANRRRQLDKAEDIAEAIQMMLEALFATAPSPEKCPEEGWDKNL
jgi:Flp pilus assembly protein TadB